MNAEALYQDLLKHLKGGLFQKASHQTMPVFLAGLAHTTFSHEQGILALFFFGLHEMYSKLYLKKKI